MRNYWDWELLIGLLLIFLIPISTFGLYSNDNPIADFVQTFTYDNDASRGIDIVNEYRLANGRSVISFDKNLYDLAYFKSKELFQNRYLDHPDKNGKCVDYYKKDFGIIGGSVADNLMKNGGVGIPFPPTYKSTITGYTGDGGWASSRGHNYNLLYPNHVSGAIACYWHICTFVGLNYDSFGSQEYCSTGEAGLAFWESAGKQMYE
jgi:uncharacterized protein YkwD